MKRSPPLNTLKAFEAAARHGSFSRAAEELYVTSAAISHQMKELEHALGVTLFNRLPRGITLTPAGVTYRESIAEALKVISNATAHLQTERIHGPLRLSLPQSFAQHWLSPRMGSLLRQYPDLQLSIDGENKLANLHAGEADIAIRFGLGEYPGLRSDFFLADAASILIATDQLDKIVESTNLKLLKDSILLEDDCVGQSEPWMSWQPWLRDLGIERDLGRNCIRFSDSAMAINACLSGAGVCIGRLSLALEALRRRQLTALVPWRSTEFAYHIVYRETDVQNPRLRAFIEWLAHEGNAFARDAFGASAYSLRTAQNL
jgi:LysR family glycine cleavage system transcriptional activator